MARPDDGGGDNSGVGYKLDVKVESLQRLATEIGDDVKDFGAEFDSWNQKSKLNHPTNAQFVSIQAFSCSFEAIPFRAASDMHGANAKSFGEVVLAARMVEAGLGALHKGADLLAKTYKNLDDANAVSLSAIQHMFPDPPESTGTDTGPKYPPADQWKALDDGWDTDGDGVANIPYPPGGKKPVDNGDKSVNSPPIDDDPTKRPGYQTATTEQRDDAEGDPAHRKPNGIDSNAFDDYTERKQELEDAVTLAPGDFGGETTQSGGATQLA